MLLKAGPTQWILQETKEMAEMNFRFVDKIDAASYVTRLANSMQISTPEHIVSGVDVVLVVIKLTCISHILCTSTHTNSELYSFGTLCSSS